MASKLSDTLEDFGLTRYESASYLALLQLGQTGAGQVIRKTGLHRQFVYSALKNLVERGLVAEQLHNRQKLFHIPDPREIGRRESERYRAVRSILPELLALQPKGTKDASIETYSGGDEFFIALLSSIDSAARTDSVVRIMGGGSGTEFYSILQGRYADYVRYTKKAKVAKRLIASAASYSEYKTKFSREQRSELRLVPFGMNAPSYTRMTKECVDIMVFGEEPLVIRIWNRTVAKAHIEHFELLWKTAEKPPARSRIRTARSKRSGA